MRIKVVIGIWHNRFEYEWYAPGGRIMEFGSYQAAWSYIVANGLPAGASAAEVYSQL